ncbi:NAD(P)-dependent alcohol dehydrogenase [Amycolatopsis sp., V23-08]|uniref:alcohol dehydrogenase (NADP(+)) n=1 Tax=Amycolatopsis heterodermiae TaxID=3110235 RepID=A0ABU5R3P3_9PSEU|nr:NAD(P)-dependent alcohol dehydrogenase [Amycolatopsis sp., V23-08]MEA5360783.1 NAD(P)-dependent alcohol dehydrogenase [Amycolatopsis sp., V23-08]
MLVTSYAAPSAGARLEPCERDSGALGALEADVRVTHCGVCHSDVGQIDNEYGITRFPCVAGHEAVGVVEAVGDAVDTELLPIGTRVGVGAIAGACFRCPLCLSGRHNLCPRRDDTVMRGDRGAFTELLRVSDWRTAYPIPDAIPSEQAAPMMCAGVTVFAPLIRHGVRPVDRAAVVGIGGLGHLALQFLSRWGCDVTAISTSRSKEDDARRFGATSFLATGEEGALADAAGSFDFILSTVSANLPWDDYLDLLVPQGRLSVVGVPPEAITVQPMHLLPAEKMISGGVPASPTETRLMLDFAARHGIGPQVETFPVAEINAAVDLVRSGRARYRAVLAMS